MNQYNYRAANADAVDSKKTLDIIKDFQLTHLPRLIKLREYYLGNQDILQRTYEPAKPDARLVHNFANYITTQGTGYFMGTPVAYENLETYPRIAEILEYNDEADMNARHATNMSIYGLSYELMYVDKHNPVDTRFTVVNPEEMVVIYDYELEPNLVLALRFYNNEHNELCVERYDDNTVSYWKEENGKLVMDFNNTAVSHYFKDVPVSVFINNDNIQGDYEQVMTLIDEYNLLSSDTANDFRYFSDAYLLLVGAEVDMETAQHMKENRIINSADSDVKASWLVKNIQDTALENYKNRLVNDIHKFSAVPNLTDEAFAGNLSGVAIKYKLLGLENVAQVKERKFKKGLQRRFELLFNLLFTRGLATSSSYLSIKPIFKRSLPANIMEEATMARNLHGLISDETLFNMLSFVENGAEELERVDAEKEARNPFGDAFATQAVNQLQDSENVEKEA